MQEILEKLNDRNLKKKIKKKSENQNAGKKKNSFEHEWNIQN